jgi:hypothetical protein
MRKQLSLLVLIAFGVNGAARADGEERPGGKGFVPLVYNWSGFYFGVHGGYGWGDSKIEEDPRPYSFTWRPIARSADSRPEPRKPV